MIVSFNIAKGIHSILTLLVCKILLSIFFSQALKNLMVRQ